MLQISVPRIRIRTTFVAIFHLRSLVSPPSVPQTTKNNGQDDENDELVVVWVVIRLSLYVLHLATRYHALVPRTRELGQIIWAPGLTRKSSNFNSQSNHFQNK